MCYFTIYMQVACGFLCSNVLHVEIPNYAKRKDLTGNWYHPDLVLASTQMFAHEKQALERRLLRLNQQLDKHKIIHDPQTYTKASKIIISKLMQNWRTARSRDGSMTPEITLALHKCYESCMMQWKSVLLFYFARRVPFRKSQAPDISFTFPIASSSSLCFAILVCVFPACI